MPRARGAGVFGFGLLWGCRGRWRLAEHAEQTTFSPRARTAKRGRPPRHAGRDVDRLGGCTHDGIDEGAALNRVGQWVRLLCRLFECLGRWDNTETLERRSHRGGQSRRKGSVDRVHLANEGQELAVVRARLATFPTPDRAPAHADELAQIGLRVNESVLSLHEERREGGPTGYKGVYRPK